MADLLKMDPARIERLRDPKRLEQVDPLRVLDVVSAADDGAVVDVGAGVGFVTLPLAKRFPERTVIGCDVLPGMLEVLADDALERELGNVVTALMSTHTELPLGDDSAALLIMLQVHHELDDAVALLTDCHRVLRPGASIAIVDWKDEDLPGMPAGGRRVAQSVIVQDLDDSGFRDIRAHDVYPLHSVVVASAT